MVQVERIAILADQPARNSTPEVGWWMRNTRLKKKTKMVV